MDGADFINMNALIRESDFSVFTQGAGNQELGWLPEMGTQIQRVPKKNHICTF